MTDEFDFEALCDTSDTNALITTFFTQFVLEEIDKNRITKAWNYLCTHTAHLSRSCGKPYYLHPLRVAFILAKNNMDADCIVSGIFHNILEIEGINANEIEAIFGATVLKIIKETTKITSLKIKNKTLQEADSVRKMLFAMVDDVRVILVKLADRLDRMRNLKSISKQSQRAVAHEVIDIWAPLAGRLGMSDVKSELEDLSLKYTNPTVFAQIKAIVAQKKEERKEYLDKVEKTILASSLKAGIKITVTSRAKHFYSIYQKMRKRGKSADELYDLLAVRIICDTVGECYTLIGIIHGLWRPLDGRFKDYIAMPKSNGYQSLHTTVICEGKPLEIQIRTHEMHKVAEHGVASHWLYKKGTNHDMVDVANLSIINQLKELRNEHLDDETFFGEVKSDLLKDEIFVFTPKGDIVELPKGSTAVDFAYHIHSAVGEKVVGAKADGKIIPLSTPLENTQIIDILTNQNAHPTVNQLLSVRTTKARSKIRAWLQANDPTFEGAPITHEVDPRRGKPRHKRPDTTPEDIPIHTHATGKIKVAGLTNFMVNLANCCKPAFPDKIVGYVSRGRGVIVHKADCTTFYRIPGVKERSLPVSWEVINDSLHN